MKITLYQNTSDNIETNKNLVYVSDGSGDFRDNQSLINPVILIEWKTLETEISVVYDTDIEIEYDTDEEIAVSIAFNINDTNYLYIEEFDRYYFINDIEVYNNQLVILSCHVDVLMSYSANFLPLDALVSRNQYEYVNYIEDDKLPFRYNTYIQEYSMPQSDEIDFNGEDGNYAITYLNDTRLGAIVSRLAPENNLGKITSFNAGINAFAHCGIIGRSDVDYLAQNLYNNDSQLSFIISLIAFPFTIPGDSSDYSRTLRLGTTDYGDVDVYYFDETEYQEYGKYYKLCQFRVDSYAGFNRGYLAYEPYCIYELYLPYYGYVDLKYADMVDSLIVVYYGIDFKTGNTKIIIYNHTKDYTIKSLNATLGVKISINRNNQQQLDDQRTSLAIKSTISGLGSVASIVGGVASKNPFLIASGVTSLTSTIADVGTKLSMMHESASASSNGGIDANYSCTTPRLKITKMQKEEPTDYAKYYGRPLNKLKNLSSIKGYTEIADIRLIDFPGTNNEKDELISLLKSGIIL